MRVKTMATKTDSDRISRLEGSYEHVATKADIANLKADIERAKWQIILAVGGIVGLITLIERWLG